MSTIYQGSNIIKASGDAIDLANLDNLYIAAGVQVATTGAGSSGVAGGQNSISNYGAIFGVASGITEANATIFVAQQASVTGVQSGIVISGGGSIINNGIIEGLNAPAITLGTDPANILNNGLITGTQSIVGPQASLSLTNSAAGVIDGGLVLNSTSGVDTIQNDGMLNGAIQGQLMTAGTHLFNKGTITGSIALGTGDDAIINQGWIEGSINLGAGNNSYDGSKGTASSFIVSGSGNDTLIGGDGDDSLQSTFGSDIVRGNGGNDYIQAVGVNAQISGGDGDDTIIRNAGFSAADKIDGGTGDDTLILAGDYSAGVAFGAKSLVNVETIAFTPGASYKMTSADSSVAAGHSMTVDGSFLGATDTLNFNGAKEKDGSFTMTGGLGGDTLRGGAGDDVLDGGAGGGKDHLTGGGGADLITPGGGKDVVIFNAVSDSTSVKFDTVVGFDAVADKFTFGVSVTAVDAPVAGGSLSFATFDSDLATAVNAAHLGAHHAELFSVTAGDLAGDTFLVVDVNGTAGYQAGQDYVVQLDSLNGSLTTSDFT